MTDIEDKAIHTYLGQQWELVKDLPGTGKKNECHPHTYVYTQALFHYHKDLSFEGWLAQIQIASNQMESYGIHNDEWIQAYNTQLAILYQDLGTLYNSVLKMSSHS